MHATPNYCFLQEEPDNYAQHAQILDLIHEQHTHDTSLGLNLTEREIVVAGLAGHFTNDEIAETLGISPRTKKGHISHALRKTNISSRHELHDLVITALQSPQGLSADQVRIQIFQGLATTHPEPAEPRNKPTDTGVRSAVHAPWKRNTKQPEVPIVGNDSKLYTTARVRQ
jgi:DNA-binding CsgD family transcriptional regulator